MSHVADFLFFLYAKAGAFSGALGDATPFNGRTVEDIAKELEVHGCQRYGDEVCFDIRVCDLRVAYCDVELAVRPVRVLGR